MVGDDDGLVRVEACGLCGTDHEQYTGELASGFAFVPGHETVGIIETIGPRAAQRWGVAAGDRVAVRAATDDVVRNGAVRGCTGLRRSSDTSRRR